MVTRQIGRVRATAKACNSLNVGLVVRRRMPAGEFEIRLISNPQDLCAGQNRRRSAIPADPSTVLTIPRGEIADNGRMQTCWSSRLPRSRFARGFDAGSQRAWCQARSLRVSWRRTSLPAFAGSEDSRIATFFFRPPAAERSFRKVVVGGVSRADPPSGVLPLGQR